MMLPYVIPLVKMDSVEPVLFAGKIVLVLIEMMELTVPSLALMAEEPVTPQDIRRSVKMRIHKDVKRMVFYGILSAKMDSMPLAVVSAHLTVLVV
jgi:hypothetical protein